MLTTSKEKQCNDRYLEQTLTSSLGCISTWKISSKRQVAGTVRSFVGYGWWWVRGWVLLQETMPDAVSRTTATDCMPAILNTILWCSQLLHYEKHALCEAILTFPSVTTWQRTKNPESLELVGSGIKGL